ncbi:HAD family hydrolase [Mahella sp.]|uniref:HAD family hydrolase n=1 Tax=Mahella sp. TaxID=2798721 RepID=UPI0025C508D7|nr:HAD family hydrolase [Mahella sp.]MBZ4664823.1 HAD-superfamily hydrolase, subfamily variant 3 [Mahella sp.]
MEEYRELVKIAGGKERMRAYFNEHRYLLPPEVLNDEFINGLHKRKTEIFTEMNARGELPIRPGIKRIIQEAHDRGVILAVCSTSNEKSVRSLLRAVLGSERLDWFDGIFAGDIVKAKKPAPDIYNLVKDQFGLQVSFYSIGEDFSEADMVVSSLGDPDQPMEIIKGHSNMSDRPIRYITLDVLEKML